MEKLEKLYEGKAKKLYATDDPDVLWVEYMNQATAGNGEKKAQIEGKGSLNNRITSVIFDLLKARGVDSHFVRRISETEQLVKKMDMYPLEIIMRNTAAGSFAKRYGVEEGTELKKPILEFCLKSDALGDPFINEDGIVALGLADEDEIVHWLAVSGKYFSLILIPDGVDIISAGATQSTSDTGITQKDTVYITGSSDAAGIDDTYYLYAGPKVAENLRLYDTADSNVFDLSDMELDEVIDGNWLSWLEAILKWILQLFYKLIPNYGVAIILLTILIKLLLQPIAKKGMDSTAKMSALAPKIEEIKQKFPDNPEAQNAAMAKLYKEEKISPMGSCIPMFVQFPIFIALYGLLNTNFDLRGSMFIPGWIPDLSIPDTIYTLPFAIPFIGAQIHLLPILYVISMIFSMKITQSTNTAGSQAGMIKFMTYGMPIIFFFIMYNAPSGLLLYWSTVNVISIGQQVLVNRKKKDVYAKEIAEKDAEKEARKEAKRKGRRR